MSKKPYIQPSVKDLSVETEDMMAASGDLTLRVSDEDVTTGYADSHRHKSVWDDEED